MNGTVNNKWRNLLRRVGLIIGLVAAAWWIFGGISIVAGYSEEMDSFVYFLPHVSLGLVFLVSIAIAWGRPESFGGVLLIIEGSFTAVSSPIIAYHCEEMTIVSILITMSLPFLISGSLFTLSCLARREHPEAGGD